MRITNRSDWIADVVRVDRDERSASLPPSLKRWIDPFVKSGGRRQGSAQRFLPGGLRRSLGLVQLLLIVLAGFPQAGLAQEIPKTYFGIHANHVESYPLQVPYGQWRGWDSGAQWQIMSKCSAPRTECQTNPSLSTVDWKRLDTILANLKQAGVDDVFYTLNRTPGWATPKPNDSNCSYGGGECWPPVGLNTDGSGPNAIWRDWITRIATRVNDPGYLKTHAHIKYWEPWNEWFENSYFGWGPKVQDHLTYHTC